MYPYHTLWFEPFSHLLMILIRKKAAIERAIKPSVATSVSKLMAMESDTTSQIASMRQRVSDIVSSLDSSTKKLNTMANRLLHEPTMRLREGKLSRTDVDEVVRRIEKQLFSINAGGR